MPKGLVRYQHTGNLHFITFSCYQRQPLLSDRSGYRAFEEELEKVRLRHDILVLGDVVTPEHVHLLVSEPPKTSLSAVLQVLKQQTSRRLKRLGINASGSGVITTSTCGTTTKQSRSSSTCIAIQFGVG
jgi:putative transposase